MTLPFFSAMAGSYAFKPGTPIDTGGGTPPTSRPTALPVLTSSGAAYYGWWDFSDTVNLTLSNGKLLSAANRVTAGEHGGAAVPLDISSQPDYLSNVRGAIGGLSFTANRKKALRFNQIDNPGPATAWTMFVVFTRAGMPAIPNDATTSKAGLLAGFGAIQVASRLSDGDFVQGVYDPDNSAVVHDINDLGSPTPLSGWVGQRWLGSAAVLAGANVGAQGLNTVRSWNSKTPGVAVTFSRPSGPYETGAQVIEIGGTGNDLTFGQPAREVIHEVLMVKGVLNDADIATLKSWADGRLYQPPVSVGSGEPAPPPGWNEVFYDNFPGNALDRNKWKIVYGGPYHNNQFDWDARGIIVNNGLTMRMFKEAGRWKAPGFQQGNLTVGPFQGYQDYQVSVKLRVPPGRGVGPYVVMWPVNDAWPPEFDILETPAGNKQSFMTTWHWRGPNGENMSESVTYVADLTKVGGTVLTVRKVGAAWSFWIDGVQQTVPAGWANHFEPNNMGLGFGSFVAASTDAWYENGPDGTTPDPFDTFYYYARIFTPGTGGTGGNTGGDFTIAQTFTADMSIGVNIERSDAWNLTSASYATYLLNAGVTHVRLTYPWRPSLDFGHSQPGTEGRVSDRPTQAQFQRVIDAAKVYIAAGLKVIIECGDDLGITSDMGSAATITHIDGHIQNCATWLAAAGLNKNKVAIGAFGEYQEGGNALWNAHRQRWLSVLRNQLPGFILITGGGNRKSKDNFIIGTAEAGLFEVSSDALVVYDFHFFSSLDTAGYNFLAQQLSDWSASKGGRPIISASWGVDATQSTNYASFIPQMQASLVPMANFHPIMWVVTSNSGGWKLNLDGLNPNFNDGSNARPDYYTAIKNQAAAVRAKLTGTTPPPVVVPPPSGTLTDVQFAQNFVAKLTMGVNIERARIWYMSYQGQGLASSAAYWDYLKSIGVTHIRGFYPWRPNIDMNGDGKVGGITPNNADIDRIYAPYKQAIARGLKVFHDCTDVINDTELTNHWSVIADYLDRSAQRAIANGLLSDMFCIGAFNELEGETNALYNQFRMDAHVILRNRLPGHVILHGGGYWNDAFTMVSTSDLWQAPPDKRVIAQWHKYDGDFFDGQLDSFAVDAQAFRDRNGGIPFVAGEAGPDDMYIEGHQQYSSRWDYFISRYAQKLPSHIPMVWAVTDGTWFRINRSGTDPTLLASLETVFRNGDAVIRSSPGWGTINAGTGGTTTPPPPPPVAKTLSWQSGGNVIGTVAANTPFPLGIHSTGYTQLQWVLVGSDYSWKTSPAAFSVTATDMTFTGAFIRATGDFIKILDPNDPNVFLDTETGTISAAPGVEPVVSASADLVGPGGGTPGAVGVILQGQSNAVFWYDDDGTYTTPGIFNDMIQGLTGLGSQISVDAARGDFTPDEATMFSGSFTYKFDNSEPAWLNAATGTQNNPSTWANTSLEDAFIAWCNTFKAFFATDRPIILIRMHNEYDLRLNTQAEWDIYEAANRNFIARWRAAMGGRPTSKLPVFTVPVPYASGVSYNANQAIRKAWKNQAADATHNFYWATSSVLDAEDRGDNSHWDPASARRAALRMAVRIARWLYDNGYVTADLSWLPTLGPRFTAAHRVAGQSSKLDVVVTHDKGTDLIMPTSPNYSNYLINDGATEIGVTGFTKMSATVVRLDLDTPISSSGSANFEYGTGFGYQGPGAQIMDNWHTLTYPAGAPANMNALRFIMGATRDPVPVT